MIEYVAEQYAANNIPDIQDTTKYTLYTGKDDNIYLYIDLPEKCEDNAEYYKYPQLYTKFPDESDSEYTYVGYKKEKTNEKSTDNNVEYTNTDILEGLLNDSNIKKQTLVKEVSKNGSKMLYDKIKVHFIYGFLLDGLSGFTLQLQTKAKTLAPIHAVTKGSQNHLEYDDFGKPVFLTERINDTSVEPLQYIENDFTLFDIFCPKELLQKATKYNKVPIYQNGCFYDRYLEFYVPSAYFLSCDQYTKENVRVTNNKSFTINNDYGYLGIAYTWYKNSKGVIHSKEDDEFKYPVYYGYTPSVDIAGNQKIYSSTNTSDKENAKSQRQFTYSICNDPTLIINFATVSSENVTTTSDDGNILSYCKFYQDPINQIAIKYKSNSDYFNIKIFEDLENNEIVYYPIFGDGDNAQELNLEIFYRIENGEIPLITEAFYDKMSGIEDFYETYGTNANKWIIYNDMTVTYNYKDTIMNRSVSSEDVTTLSITKNFTNVIDYSNKTEEDGEFWKSYFIPKIEKRNGKTINNILITYTCRLSNRITNVEAIRTATIRIDDAVKYQTKQIAINNVVTYKIVNQIKKNEIKYQSVAKETTDKLVRSYYDVTNIVVKDMGNNNLYTQGQMTLYLKHSSSNYAFRLYTLNEDNVRIPFDLTGPYKYKLVFPTQSGSKISIQPNSDSTSLNMGIGQLIFYITEDQVKQIMNVSSADRYFAITSDTENSDQLQSTLYEGKVSYYS